MDPRVEAYLKLLFAWNPGAGLTAFKDPAEALARGVAPALEALPLLPEAGDLLDVGSGGGFPAVPLALARPRLRVTCCEPAAKKAAFLREVSRALALGLSVKECSAEEFLRVGGSTFDAVTVRGVRLRRPLLRLLVGALGPGGGLLVWTGGDTLATYRAALEGLGLASVGALPLREGSALLHGNVPRGTSEG